VNDDINKTYINLN